MTSDEKKRSVNLLRNKHHFKKSNAEMQVMRDELKRKVFHRKETMEKEKNEREDKMLGGESKTPHGSDYWN
jgi:hypothetical protein